MKIQLVCRKGQFYIRQKTTDNSWIYLVPARPNGEIYTFRWSLFADADSVLTAEEAEKLFTQETNTPEKEPDFEVIKGS